MILDELIARLRSGEYTLEEFATAAAGAYVYDKRLVYPETDGNGAVLNGPSAVTISNAVHFGRLTQEEADAIYAALPEPEGRTT